MVLVDMRMVNAGVAAVVMGQDIVMERSVLSAPEAAVAVISAAGGLFVKAAALHRFSHQAPLEGEILVPIK